MALSLRRVSHKYGDLQVLSDVNVDVETGGFTVLLGPSGCGKSTLLRIIAGLERPVVGRVEVDGVDVTGRPGQVGLVFQESALFPWLTTQANVEFGLRAGGVTRKAARERAEELLALVDLLPARHLYPAQLSGGMTQRAALARALAPRPRVLLLDEPFASVDMQLRNALQTELLRIWSVTGTTMVFVTHSVDEAVYLGQRLLVVKQPECSVIEEIAIDLRHPRVRTEARFVAIRHKVLAWLQTQAGEEGCQSQDNLQRKP